MFQRLQSVQNAATKLIKLQVGVNTSQPTWGNWTTCRLEIHVEGTSPSYLSDERHLVVCCRVWNKLPAPLHLEGELCAF